MENLEQRIEDLAQRISKAKGNLCHVKSGPTGGQFCGGGGGGGVSSKPKGATGTVHTFSSITSARSFASGAGTQVKLPGGKTGTKPPKGGIAVVQHGPKFHVMSNRDASVVVRENPGAKVLSLKELYGD